MRKRFAVIILLDIVVIVLWAYWVNNANLTQGEAMGAVLMIPALIIASGVIGFFLSFNKSKWSNILLINVGIALVLFISMFNYQSWKYERDNYLKYYFTNLGQTYQIILHLKDEKQYEIYQKLSEHGNMATDLDGTYIQKNDTLILTSDLGKVMKIYNDTLFNYRNQGDRITLSDIP